VSAKIFTKLDLFETECAGEISSGGQRGCCCPQVGQSRYVRDATSTRRAQLKIEKRGSRGIKNQQRPAFKLAPIAMLIAASGVFAQQAAPSSETTTVTVTGIRKSIEDAISVKRNSDGIVEAISAEDLGKLPDASIADSIARLPGVAAQRNIHGNASQLSVRGMPPDFATTLLNGREQVNPGDGRGAEFDAYPTELLNGVVLYKTPDASLMGQGIAGTIDLQTVRPLSVSGRKVNIGLNQQKTAVGLDPTGSGNNFSVSYIDQFMNNTWGLAVGFARNKTEGNGRGVNSFSDSGQSFPDGTKLALRKSVSEITRPTQSTRDGAMAVIEFKPSKDFSSTLDLFYSTNDHKTRLAQLAFPDFNQGTLSNATIVNGMAVAGTISGVQALVQSNDQNDSDKNFAFGWNNKFNLSKEWSGVIDISQSKSTRHAAQIDSNAYTGVRGTLTFDSRTEVPTFGYSDNLANPGTMNLTGSTPWGIGWLKMPNIEDKMDSVRISVRRSLQNDYFNAFTVGVNYSDRNKILDWHEGAIAFVNGTNSAAIPNPYAVTAGLAQIPVLAWASLDAVGPVYKWSEETAASWAKSRAWEVKEKSLTTYAKLDLDTTAGKVPVRGNVGVQVVKTDQSSTGYNTADVATWNDSPAGGPNVFAVQAAGMLSGSKTYTDVLPSLNLAFEVDDSQIVRFGAGKVIARPSLYDLRANSKYECWSPLSDPKSCSGNHSGSGGNPELEPFRATAIDLAYEKYFAKRAYVGAAVFYKDLQTFIYNQTFKTDVIKSVFNLDGYPTLDYSGPKNGEGGSISGFELTANLPFDLLTPVLSGFGAFVNHSDTSSSVNLPNSAGGTASKMDLPGLSKRVTNLNVYYEKAGFSARIGQRKRSDFVGSFTTNEYGRDLTYIKGETIIDLQVGYEFKAGAAKGLSLVFQANNLTDALFQKYELMADGSHQTRESAKYGKSYMLGANYRF
jgi:iron complex outermembrane receptor protein